LLHFHEVINVIVALFARFTPEMTDTQQDNIDHNNDVKSKVAAEEELQQAFNLFDANKDGMISMEEMRMLLTKVGGQMSEGQVKAVMAIADRDKNSLIDFAEFHSLWSLVLGEIEEESEIREEFKRFDLDKNGYITKDEMLKVIESSGSFVQDKLEEARKCIAEMDVDDDGQVSYPEFLLIWRFRE